MSGLLFNKSIGIQTEHVLVAPALTSSITQHKLLQLKNSFATIVNELSVLKLFQLSNGYI